MNRFLFLATMQLAIVTAITVLPSQSSVADEASKKTPIILDTDIGTDVDDAFALALAGTSPELELVGVTTVNEDPFTRAMIACRMLYAIGKKDVPVAAGGPRVGTPKLYGQYQYGLRPARKFPVKQRAVEFLYEQLKKRRGELTLVAVGPLTNIAALLKKHPDCKPWIKRLVIMGGSVRVGYNAKAPPVPEWNIKSDIKAAQTVFNAGVPLVVAPLDATTMLKLDAKQRERLFAAGIPLTNELHTLYELWNKPTPVLYDPVAVTLSFTERFCRMEKLRLTVDDRGVTHEAKGKPNALVATSIKKDEFLDWYVGRIISRRFVVHIDEGGKLVVGLIPESKEKVAKEVKERLKRNPGMTAEIAAHPKSKYAIVAELLSELRRSGVKAVVIAKSRRRPVLTNVVKPVKDAGLPRRVHVFEDYETDIERRWWLSGRLETKDVPPSRSDSVSNKRACRATLTHNFDGQMGDQSRLYRAVIFNPVPGPPMGPRTRLSFRYRIKGSGSLRVQIYSLSKGFHRFLTLNNLTQGKWQSATVDMTQARRPDGSGGPLSENERIDDIQFYTSPDADLLIDDIVLYDAEAKPTGNFPSRFIFTGWFDTGRQGREWPGDFEIVPHEKPRTWDAIRSVLNKKTGKPWIRVSLRGLRPVGETTAMRFQYKLTGAGPLEIQLVNSKTGERIEHTIPKPATGKWTEVTFIAQHSGGKKRATSHLDEVQFHVPKGAVLLVDDVLLYEP